MGIREGTGVSVHRVVNNGCHVTDCFVSLNTTCSCDCIVCNYGGHALSELLNSQHHSCNIQGICRLRFQGSCDSLHISLYRDVVMRSEHFIVVTQGWIQLKCFGKIFHFIEI